VDDPNFAYLFGSTGDDTMTLGSGGGYMFGEGGTNNLNGGTDATNLLVGGDGGTDTMNGGFGTASNFYFVDGNDQVNGSGAFNTVIELVGGVTVQLDSAQYQDVQEFVANSGANTVTVANTDTDFTYLYGGAGNDTLTTGSGGGYLFGEGGTNVLTGGGGLNVFVANGASDRARRRHLQHRDRVAAERHADAGQRAARHRCAAGHPQRRHQHGGFSYRHQLGLPLRRRGQ
jgi:Ca2+-binding RTX toxin-like protein